MKGWYSLDYVRHFYGVPAKRGMRVMADGKPGAITSGDGAHIRIRLDGEKHSGSWHPLWRIDYGDGIDYAARHDARVDAFTAAIRSRSSASGGRETNPGEDS